MPSNFRKGTKAWCCKKREWHGYRTPSRWIKCELTRICPKDILYLKKAGSNLGIVMSGFSPMVPHDLTNSTIPVQVFELTVENRADRTRSVELALRHRDALVVRHEDAVLVNDKGETAFACDDGTADVHGLSRTLKLAPGKRQTLRFYIAWDYPAIKTTSSAARETYRRYYTKRFQNADQIIALAKKSADTWSAEIDQWHTAFEVPPAFKRLWFSALCSVSTSTILTTYSYFFEQEVPHGWVNTMDVSVYHNWLYLVNWPEIERMDMNQYYQSIATTGQNAGLVWHWDDSSDYAEEPTFLGWVYRDLLWFNDPEYPDGQRIPTGRSCCQPCLSRGPLSIPAAQSRGQPLDDIWKMPGVNAYVNVMWVYGLYSLDRLSQKLNQPSTVDGLPVAEMFAKARQSLDRLLWNADGYWNAFYVPTNRTEDADGLKRTDGQDTFSDQLFGKWLSLIDHSPRACCRHNRLRPRCLTFLRTISWTIRPTAFAAGPMACDPVINRK